MWCVLTVSALKLMANTSTRFSELIENNNIKVNVCIVKLMNIHENEVKM